MMLFGAVAQDRFHIAGVGRRAIETFRTNGGPPHDLANLSVFVIG
jgi:hypothetical protein